MSDGSFSTKARDIIWRRANGHCERCGRFVGVVGAPGWSFQHRKARGLGGTDDSSKGDPCNGALLCGSATTGCHGWVESNPILGGMEGFRVESFVYPADVPILLHSRQWAYLDDTEQYARLVSRAGGYR